MDGTTGGNHQVVLPALSGACPMCVDVRYYHAATSSRTENPPSASIWWNRAASAASWLLPSAALALMPKCPACFAAYFAAATGLGLSLSTAAHFRSAALAVCALWLLAISLAIVVRLRRLGRG